jgi:hypothetical protein
VTLSHDFKAFRGFTRLTRFQLKRVPAGATVRVTCAIRKKKCPKGVRKPLTVRNASGTVTLKRYTGIRLRVGTRITVTVTKRNMLGAVKVLEVRRSKTPRITDLCLPPGAKRAQRRW